MSCTAASIARPANPVRAKTPIARRTAALPRASVVTCISPGMPFSRARHMKKAGVNVRPPQAPLAAALSEAVSRGDLEKEVATDISNAVEMGFCERATDLLIGEIENSGNDHKRERLLHLAGEAQIYCEPQ